MVGKKTHEQQFRVIQKQKKTPDAGKDFDIALDLK